LPLPAGIMVPAPNALPAEFAEQGRAELWRRYTGQSLEFAQRVGGEGDGAALRERVFLFLNPAAKVNMLTTELEGAETPLLETAEYTTALAKLLGKLRKAGPKHYGRVPRRVHRAAEKAKVCGVKFGWKNARGCWSCRWTRTWRVFWRAWTRWACAAGA